MPARSVEDKVNSILSTNYLRNNRIKDLNFIRNQLHKAVVVSRTSAMQQMIRKIILKEYKSGSKKIFSVVNQVKEGDSPLIKGIESAKKCHGNHSFRLSYLEQLLLEDQISLREFKQLKEVFIKKQLQFISELSKNRQGKSFNAKAIKKDSPKPLDNHINPYHK
jgi:hypothetical protein